MYSILFGVISPGFKSQFHHLIPMWFKGKVLTFLCQFLILKWVKSLSQVRLFATPWTAAYHAPPSMGFSRQEYWSRVPSPSPMTNLDSIKKQRRHFANKSSFSQSHGFSSNHIWMWELDHKESWAPKNWCFFKKYKFIYFNWS